MSQDILKQQRAALHAEAIELLQEPTDENRAAANTKLAEAESLRQQIQTTDDTNLLLQQTDGNGVTIRFVKDCRYGLVGEVKRISTSTAKCLIVDEFAEVEKG